GDGRRGGGAGFQLLLRSESGSAAAALSFRAPSRDTRACRGTAEPSRGSVHHRVILTPWGNRMPSFRRNSFGPLAVAMALSLLLGFGLARGLQATDDLRSQL